MRSLFLHFRRLDWALTASALLLTGFGLLSIYSSSLGRGNFLNFEKQIIFWIIGLFLMLLLSFLDWRIFRQSPYFILLLYFLSLLFLAGLYFLAPEVKGVKGWYKLGPVSFDPIEFAKLTLIILLAKYFSMRHVEMYKLRHIFLSGFYIFLPAVLIFFQPDFGSVLILIALWLAVLFISGIKLRHFLLLIFTGILLLIFSWSFLLKDYQKARVIGFLTPQIEVRGINWSQTQSKIAIGSGGFFGQGVGRGSQTQYGFLSEPQTDFIFAAIAEEFGLIGVSVLLFLFVILFWRIMSIVLNIGSNFCRLFASGLAVVLFAQMFIHIGMNLGFLPVIGISLPFVSYGGSGLIAVYIGLGILESIKAQ
jgi:rod shape determining protein RodA